MFNLAFREYQVKKFSNYNHFCIKYQSKSYLVFIIQNRLIHFEHITA